MPAGLFQQTKVAVAWGLRPLRSDAEKGPPPRVEARSRCASQMNSMLNTTAMKAMGPRSDMVRSAGEGVIGAR
jgi:hypothetical protein